MATPSPSHEQHTLSDLANVIASNATVVDEELGSKGLPPLDDETFPSSFPLLSPEGSRARFELLSAALTLFRLASGPSEALDHVTMQGFELGTIATLLRLRIPEHIPLGSAVSLQTLSQLTSIDLDLLTRLIRYAISIGFLAEPEPGLIRHNALSAATARDHNMRDSALWNVIVGAPGAIRMYESLQLDPTGRDNTKTGLSVAMEERGETRGTMWDYHALHPEDEVRFNNAMASTETVSIHACEHVVRGFDWSKVGTVVDVGGNEGHLCMTIINTYPHITATIQDQARVVATSAPLLPPKYNNSITFKEHDFFHPQTTIADVYILRFILHDWPDDKARDIIRNLLPALKPGARILIVDHVVPSFGAGAQKVNRYMERIVRQMDVTMFGLLAGRERSEEDFKRLFGEVESRLEYRGCTTPDGSSLSILEFQFTG